MEIIEKSIILSFDELRILLFSQGYRSCEGVFMPEKDFSHTDILRALQKLVRGGLLSIDAAGPQTEALPLVFEDENEDDSRNDGLLKTDMYPDEQFYIRRDLLRIIGIIGEHRASEIIALADGRKLFCYYSEDGIVTSERYRGKKDAVRLSCYTAEEFDDLRNAGDAGL